MASSWIKVEVITPDKPEIFQIAELLNIDPDAVLGKLVRIWAWADQQTIDGTRRAMYQRQLSEIEVEKHARKLLEEWAVKVAAGHQIPDPVLSIQAKPEPIQTPADTEGIAYHPPGKSFGCMPNAATLGGLTPAQWLMEEYRRGKAAGLIR